MAEFGSVTRVLLDMVRDGADDRELAGRIGRACVTGLDIDGASISVLTTADSRQTLWASDPVAELLEDLQFTLNEGACMDAATSGIPVLVPDLRHATETARWPLFAAALAERSALRALFALPMQWGTENLGVIDLYRVRPGGLSRAEQRDALSAADVAALMLLGHRTDPDGEFDGGAAPGGWLEPSWGHRAEVHQATGMVLVQLGISATDALARMRGHAFVHQRLLVDVARDVVARRLVFTPDMD